MVVAQQYRGFTFKNQDYFYVNPESPRHYSAALDLCNNYVYLDKHTPKIDKQDFLEFTQDPQEINVIYLLYELVQPLLYFSPTDPQSKNTRLIKLKDVITEEYHCLSMVGTYQRNKNKKTSSLIKLYSDTICRSPFTDADLSAYFTDKCFQDFSESLGGGVSEYEICISTSDVPLQLAFKKLGYICFDENSEVEEYYFSKTITPDKYPKKSTKRRHKQ